MNTCHDSENLSIFVQCFPHLKDEIWWATFNFSIYLLGFYLLEIVQIWIEPPPLQFLLYNSNKKVSHSPWKPYSSSTMINDTNRLMKYNCRYILLWWRLLKFIGWKQSNYIKKLFCILLWQGCNYQNTSKSIF